MPYYVRIYTNHEFDESEDENKVLFKDFQDVTSALSFICNFLRFKLNDFIKNYAGQDNQRWYFASCGSDGMLHNPCKEEDYLDAGISIILYNGDEIDPYDDEIDPYGDEICSYLHEIAIWEGSYTYCFDGSIEFYRHIDFKSWAIGENAQENDINEIRRIVSSY